MAGAAKASQRRVIVIFDSRYGNTEKIARSFEAGLKQAGVETLCIRESEVKLDSLKQYDLIAVGAPTEKFTASKIIKEFLEKLRSIDLKGKFGFAFDTRFGFPLSGSAAKFIEKELKSSRLEIVVPRESALVVRVKEAEGGVKLKDGEEKRFEQFGKHVATALAARGNVISV